MLALTSLVFALCLTLGQSECLDVTFDDCDGAPVPFEIDDDISETLCQKICQLYEVEKSCGFFIFNKALRRCELYDYQIHVYDETCKTVGSIPDTDVMECQNSDGECDVST